MSDRDVAYWEDLARREAYFPVLATDGHFATRGDAVSSDRFFATGEADVSTLLSALRATFGRAISLDSALDFGCGAGRLTLPLARCARKVVACDIAPTMLAHGRKNAEAAGLPDVVFVSLAELAEMQRPSFDFICSLCVFQYVPASEGYGLIRLLASLLVPGGIAAIQIRLGGPRSGARFARQTSRDVRAEDIPARIPGLGMNAYNGRRIGQSLADVGSRLVARFPVGEGDPGDAVWIIERD